MKCPKCGVEHDSRRPGTNGHDHRCSACVCKYQREWYSANKLRVQDERKKIREVKKTGKVPVPTWQKVSFTGAIPKWAGKGYE